MKNSLVSDLSHVLRELHGMKALLHVGLKRNSAKGKIDFLAGCDEGSIEKYSQPIMALMKDRWPTGNFFVCDDSVRFDLPMGSGGVAVYDSALLVRQIEEWIEGRNLGGQHRPWVAGYWLPEALCGDLATAKTLYDVTDISSGLGNYLLPTLFRSRNLSLSCVLTKLGRNSQRLRNCMKMQLSSENYASRIS